MNTQDRALSELTNGSLTSECSDVSDLLFERVHCVGGDVKPCSINQSTLLLV